MRSALLAAFLLLAAAPGQTAPKEVLSGLDNLIESGFSELKGKSVGLITNHTGLDRKGRSTVQALASAPGLKLNALFAPEHGFSGTQDEENLGSGVYFLPDGRQIPLYSLYGSTRAPTAAMLKGIDALVFDIQDIGARFYTYATTMAMAMEAAAKADVQFYVLDRPNPITGSRVEGSLLDEGQRFFTAYHPVPIRHGMTMGELARHYNLRAKIGASLHIVPVKGWDREQWYDETGLPWTKPSPNMPDIEAAALYPGIGCFEATNVSVGRGTKIPFRWVGAPWMDAKAVVKKLQAANLKGVEFDVKNFTPEKSVFAGEKSHGVRITIVDRNALMPLEVFVHLAVALRDLHPKEFVVRRADMAKMTGTQRFNDLYDGGAGAEAILEMFRKDSETFRAERAAFLLY